MLVIKPGFIIFHSEAPYERYVIRVSPVNLHRNMPILLERTKSVYYIAGTPLEEEFLRMDRHLSTLHPDAHVNACIGSMDLILSYLISSEELTQDAAVVDVESKRILDYIDAHLAEVHSLEDLARGLSMSKSTLYRVFSRQLDTPLMTYVRTQQCMLARNFLMEGIPAIEVASRLGFSHYSSFYRSYREVFHEAPTVKHR